MHRIQRISLIRATIAPNWPFPLSSLRVDLNSYQGFILDCGSFLVSRSVMTSERRQCLPQIPSKWTQVCNVSRGASELGRYYNYLQEHGLELGTPYIHMPNMHTCASIPYFIKGKCGTRPAHGLDIIMLNSYFDLQTVVYLLVTVNLLTLVM